MHRDPPAVSLVVALRNEAANVRDLHRRSVAALGELGRAWEIVYVDDGSDDGSAQRLLEEIRDLPGGAERCRVLRQEHPRGKTQAWRRGFAAAAGGLILTIDADLQEPPEAFRGMIAPLDQGWDMVVGWRRHRRDAPAKVRASRCYNAAVGLLTGSGLHDINCGSKAMKAEVAKRLVPLLIGDMHRYVVPLASSLGYRVTEIEVEHRPRARGGSRYGPDRYYRAFRDLWLVLPRLRRGRFLILAGCVLAAAIFPWRPWAAALVLAAEAAYLGGCLVETRRLERRAADDP